MHMQSMKLRTNGTVTISSTVLDRSSKVRGRSAKTSGFLATKGRAPAVVERKPASWRRFRRATAVVDPPRVLRRSRRAFHSYAQHSCRMIAICKVSLARQNEEKRNSQTKQTTIRYTSCTIFLRVSHTLIALGPSSPHCSMRSSSNPFLVPMGKRQYPSGVQKPRPL